MKKSLAILVSLSGCGSSSAPLTSGGSAVETTFTTKDGRILECIRIKDGYGVSLDCNWANPLND